MPKSRREEIKPALHPADAGKPMSQRRQKPVRKVKRLPGGISYEQQSWRDAFAARHGLQQNVARTGETEVALVEDLD